jgi:hypothetical protein
VALQGPASQAVCALDPVLHLWGAAQTKGARSQGVSGRNREWERVTKHATDTSSTLQQASLLGSTCSRWWEGVRDE